MRFRLNVAQGVDHRGSSVVVLLATTRVMMTACCRWRWDLDPNILEEASGLSAFDFTNNVDERLRREYI